MVELEQSENTQKIMRFFNSGNKDMRRKLGKIVSSKNEENWYNPKLFEKNIRLKLPKDLEILSVPPVKNLNYNCFVYVLRLQNNPLFLGNVGWDFTHSLGNVFDELIKNKVLKKIDTPQKDDLIIYRADSGEISHVGLVASQQKIISKWSWGPVIKHSIFNVPDHYGNNIEFYGMSDLVVKLVLERNKE